MRKNTHDKTDRLDKNLHLPVLLLCNNFHIKVIIVKYQTGYCGFCGCLQHNFDYDAGVFFTVACNGCYISGNEILSVVIKKREKYGRA